MALNIKELSLLRLFSRYPSVVLVRGTEPANSRQTCIIIYYLLKTKCMHSAFTSGKDKPPMAPKMNIREAKTLSLNPGQWVTLSQMNLERDESYLREF